jgi:hypothetical protein
VASYYYFASQLPFLVYGQEPPLESAYFREQCRYFMTEKDRDQLDRCTFDMPREGPSGLPPGPGESPAPASPFIRAWREWERALKLNLERCRSQRLKKESPNDAPGYPADAAAAAKAAAALDSPLEAEILLDRARWDAIETYRGLDNFGSDALFAYLLKLVLMERRSSFKTGEGFAEYKTLYDSIIKSGNAEMGAAK